MRQAANAIFASELILKFSVSLAGIKELDLPGIVRVELVLETTQTVHGHEAVAVPRSNTQPSNRWVRAVFLSPGTDFPNRVMRAGARVKHFKSLPAHAIRR